MSNPKAFETWEDALTEALALARNIDKNHRLAEVSFGTFAERIGGGHYVELAVAYSLGNTVGASHGGDSDRARTAQIVKAWSEAVEASRSAGEPT